MSFLLAILAATATAPAETDALAQMQAWKILCTYPDETAHTCTSIEVFVEQPDGSFIATSETLLPGGEGLSLEISSTVRVENGAICGTIDLADMQKGMLRMNGLPLPPEQNVAALGKLIERLKPMAGRKVCEALHIVDGQLLKFGQIDGVDINLPGKPVRWVMSDEGYRLAPR